MICNYDFVRQGKRAFTASKSAAWSFFDGMEMEPWSRRELRLKLFLYSTIVPTILNTKPCTTPIDI